MNLAKMREQLEAWIELGLPAEDIYNAPSQRPEYAPFVVTALVLGTSIKDVPVKVLELIKKQIEHDLLMAQHLPKEEIKEKKSFLQRLREKF